MSLYLHITLLVRDDRDVNLVKLVRKNEATLLEIMDDIPFLNLVDSLQHSRWLFPIR